HQVHLHLAGTEDPEYLVRVDRALDELLAHRHAVALGHQEPGPHRHRDGDLLTAVVGDDDDLAGLLGLLDLDPALHLTDGGHALWGGAPRTVPGFAAGRG